MMEESLVPQERAKTETSSHIVHALLQFTMAIKHRKSVVILCVFIALALGALYYSTAVRLYSAQAELLILASGDETNRTGISGQGKDGSNLMQTFERVITSSNVIEEAIERLRDDERVDLVEVPRAKWVTTIQKNLSAKSVYGTNNIEIEYLSRDPAAAVAVVNQVVESYLEFMDVIHRRTADDLIRGLEEQQKGLNQELEQWNRLLSQQKRECGDFLSTDPDRKSQHPIQEELLLMKKERFARQTELVEMQAKLELLERAVANGEDLEPHIMAIEDTVGTDMLKATMGLDANLANTRQKKLDDISELTALLPHYGEGHPHIRELRSRIQEADQILAGGFLGTRNLANAQDRAALGRSLVGFMRQRVAQLAGTERGLAAVQATLERQAESISDKLIAIQTTERQIEWYNEYRERLLNQLAILSGAEDGPIVRAEKISDPVQALNPTSPNLRRVAALALLAGLAMGLASVYVLDTLDDRFRTVEELQAQVGVPVLAIVQDLPQRQGVGVGTLQLVADPDAPESEAFRTLRTSLALTQDQSRRIVVTSPEPGDGKSTVLANMAVACASSGKRTLLIDADLRRPGLSSMLGIRGAEGVSAVIRAEQPIGEIVESHVRQTAVRGLDVLPAGPRAMNPAELLGSQRFADMLAWAEGRYDRVLIDSPPTLAASDSALIGQLVDGVLLVVQPHKNQRRLVLRVAETFSMLKIPLIGMVANRVGGHGRSDDYAYSVDYSAQGEEDVDYLDYGDEVDCPPEPTKRSNSRQFGGPRHRDAA